VEEELRATYLFQRNWSLHPAIQTEIAKVVVDQLQAKLSPMGKAQTERRPMENSEAYLAFSQDRSFTFEPTGSRFSA